MASQQFLTTVTLSGSFTTGPSGGLLPAAPTNRLQDFPLPSDYTPLGERFNFAILAALASPLVVAILIIAIETIACYRWKRKTARLENPTKSRPLNASNISGGTVAELSTAPVAELAARSESEIVEHSETTSTESIAEEISGPADTGAEGGMWSNE
ncbi:hypothetical protein G7Y89_g6325 [Cudoniella acicularis]|uniref:Uncharacterized protein n=1 Tax=Cudoniella acicularis TaxID=354080 RepID=A0A8H4W4W3_9HELO|nr:hypothetical protein G7Y89_g6325 [Cudoniella acicularis]